MMLGFVQGLGADSHEITVLSGSPDETYRVYGLTSVPRRDSRAVDAAIADCDCLVFPGGSIFQDVTSFASVNHYQGLVKKAKRAGKKVVLLGQGVGPLTGFLGKRAAVDAFTAADAVAVRDPQSLETLKSLGVKRPVQVTADMAFLLPPPTAADDVAGFNVGSMLTVGVAPRPFGKGKATVELFADLARLLFKANFMPVLIEMDRNEDGEMIQAISKAQGGRIPDLRKLVTPMQLQQRLLRMDSVIAMRLHCGILAAGVGIPPFLVSYDPKVAALGRLLDMGGTVGMEGLTAQRLFDSFVAFQKDRDRNVKILARKQAEMINLAQQNIEILREHVRPVAKI